MKRNKKYIDDKLNIEIHGETVVINNMLLKKNNGKCLKRNKKRKIKDLI